MSIYTGYRALPSDVQVSRVADKPAPEASSQQSIPHHLRRARPALVILPRTAVWISLLPLPIRPTALIVQFARIANEICAVWSDPPACRDYLAALLSDRRGGRKGFPTAVLGEIQVLQRFHAHLHASANANLRWTDPSFSDT